MSDSLLRRETAEVDVGQRLDLLVAGWLGESRSRSQARIEDGEVHLDGLPVVKSAKVLAGQEVVVAAPPPPPPLPRPPHVEVRYADEHLAVVAKPADLVVHEGAGVRGATLVDALQRQGLPLAPGEDPSRPGIVHRLDRGTSGLLVVALSEVALTRLKEVFALHAIHRSYWALVEGVPDPPAATIDAPIIRSPTNRTAFTTGDGGRRAVTHFTTTAVHRDTAEVEVTLETGRTHQVRVHLSAIGNPVVGDVLYGARKSRAKVLGLGRQALHAQRLAFDHPVTGDRIDMTEPLPADLVAAQTTATR